MEHAAFFQRIWEQPDTLTASGAEWRLLFVRGGSGAAEINGKEKPLRRGDAVCVGGAGIRITKANRLSVFTVDIPAVCLPAGQEKATEKGSAHLPAEMLSQAEYLLDAALLEHREKEGASALMLNGLAFCLLALVQKALKTQPAAAPTEAVDAALRYMEDHAAEEITLSQLAKAAGLSPRQMDRQFSAAFGMTPMRYVAQLRMTRAKALLRGTARPITEIAFDCGYADSNYFARVFRKVCGLSPQQYRQAREEV